MKRYLAGILAGLVMLTSVGCGSSKSMAVTTDSSAAYDYGAEMEVSEEAAMEEDSGDTIQSESGIEAVSETERKLIKTVYLEMQTKEFDAVLENLPKNVEELGGYVQTSTLNGSSYYSTNNRSAYFTVRIPADRLDEFVQVVGELGNVTYKSENVEDVTLQYVDTESRKKALETERDRLLELMEQAENMEDLLAIESKLSEVRYELENYGSQLRLLDNQIDYSTVNVDIMEVERITEVKERTFFQEAADRFGDSVYAVGRGFRSFGIWFIGSLPILAVWVVILLVVLLIIRTLFRRRRKKPLKGKDPERELPSKEET